MDEISNSELVDRITNKIKESIDKRLTFYEFMSMALYEEDLGYYTRDKSKIGKNADFYTSSSVGPIFGQIIGKSFIEMFSYASNEEQYAILEMGGGNGRFSRDVLDFYKKEEPLIYEKVNYFMLETSPYHKTLQAEYLKNHLDKIVWIDNLNELNSFEGVIFSNELVDSFPVHKVKQINGEFQEVYVTFNENSLEFEEQYGAPSTPLLKEYFDIQGITLREGQTAEVNLNGIKWIEEVSRILKKGFVITIDYGYPADELYTTYRNDGTLMCYYRHIANDNPYQNIGDQDITTHVNFSILMDIGAKNNLETVWFTTQSHYLINNGILDYLKEVDMDTFDERNIIQDEGLRLNRAIRQLITPTEMGETFKILVQQKNITNRKYQFQTEIWEKYGMNINFE